MSPSVNRVCPIQSFFRLLLTMMNFCDMFLGCDEQCTIIQLVQLLYRFHLLQNVNLFPILILFGYQCSQIVESTVGTKPELVIAMRWLLPNVPWYKATKEELQTTILKVSNDYCLHLSTKYVTELHSLLYIWHLQCAPEYSQSILLSIMIEFYYGMHLFSILKLPPAGLPNVSYTETCYLDYHDLFDNDMSFPSQILISPDIHHSLNILHPSCKPDSPWKFNELSKGIIDNFVNE